MMGERETSTMQGCAVLDSYFKHLANGNTQKAGQIKLANPDLWGPKWDNLRMKAQEDHPRNVSPTA